ncbi:hypothetical protein ACA910_001955 [Epithemia clementina (nom. ined.)]
MNTFITLFLTIAFLAALSAATNSNESQIGCMFSKRCQSYELQINKALRDYQAHQGQKLSVYTSFSPGSNVNSMNAKMPCCEESLDSKIAAFYTENEIKGSAPTCQNSGLSDCYLSSYSCSGSSTPQAEWLASQGSKRQLNLENNFSNFCLADLGQYLVNNLPDLNKECQDSILKAKDFCVCEAIFFA